MLVARIATAKRGALYVYLSQMEAIFYKTYQGFFVECDPPPIKRTSKPIKEMSDAQEQSTKENLEI